MSVFIARGSDENFRQNLSFTLQSYLSHPVRGSLQKLLTEARDSPDNLSVEAKRKLDTLYQLLFDSTVSVWGTTSRYAETFEQIREGDTLLYVAKREEVYVQDLELLLGPEIPDALRTKLSEYLWRDNQYEYLWFTTTPVKQAERTDQDIEQAIQEELDPNFDYEDNWFPSQSQNFTRVAPGYIDEAGGTASFIDLVCGTEPDPIEGQLTQCLVVDEKFITEHNDELVATKYSANQEYHLDRAEPDEHPEDYGYTEDNRVKYVHLPPRHPDRTKLLEAAYHSRVFIRDGGTIVATGQLGNVERPRHNGQHRLGTLFDYRETAPFALHDILAQNEANETISNDVSVLDEALARQLRTALSNLGLRDAVADLEAEDQFRDDLYWETAAHLVAGKNIIFYGPPGSGKTRAARLTAKALADGFNIETASANWSNYDVVGGFAPGVENGDRVWRPSPGLLSTAVNACTDALKTGRGPHWLVLDELNRANLDEAFGDVFTLLDVDYRREKRLKYADAETYVPFSFRLLATMNESDRAQLFTLGYAFRRRFAFVNIPSLLATDETYTYSDDVATAQPVRDDINVVNQTALRKLIRNATIEQLKLSQALPSTYNDPVWPPEDAVTIEPSLALEPVIADAYDTLTADGSFGWPDANPIDVVLEFATLLDDADIVELGQAVAIDVATFLTAAQLLQGEDNLDRRWVDRAITAYILPQLDAFMSELKREETLQLSNRDNQEPPSDRYDRVIALAEAFDLPQTGAKLRLARESHRII